VEGSSRFADAFGTLEHMMTETEPDYPALGTEPGAGSPAAPAVDPLAARLLAVQRALSALAVLGADSEAYLRLNQRFMAICTALKMPGASRIRCIRRLNELMAEAEQVRASNRPAPRKEV
jgi:hypothetical protein